LTGSKRYILPALSVLLVIVVLFYKTPDAFYNSQFWAEEGTVFFSEVYHNGISALFNTCLGYFHLYPRLVFFTGLIFGLPMEWMPYLSCYSWLFMELVLLLYIWTRIEVEPVKKFFIALCTVIIPIQSEVLMNLTNVQWIMALFPIIIFSCTNGEKNKKWLIADLLILTISGFTGPHMLVLLPLILLLFFTQKKVLKPRLTLFMGVATLAAISVFISLQNHGSISRREGQFDVLNPAFINYIYEQYAMLFLGKFAFDTPVLLKYLAVAILLVFAVYISFRILKGHIKQPFTIFTFFTGILFLVATLVAYRNDPAVLHPHYGAARNFYLPAVCFLWFFISLLKPSQHPAWVLSLLMLLLTLENFRAVERKNLIDYGWGNYAGKIKSSDTLSIPINPPGWRIFIDNSQVPR
jgi:hypothetical protein